MNKVSKLVEEAKDQYEKAVQLMDETDSRIQALPDDAPEEEVALLNGIFERQSEDVARSKQTWERQIAISNARQAIPPVEEPELSERGREASTRSLRFESTRIAVGREPLVYEPGSPHSYFRDLVYAEIERDQDARERLMLHGKQVIVNRAFLYMDERYHNRDITTADPGAASFVPPIYMGQDWIDKTGVAGRPFADRLPKIPLSPVGKQMDFPRVQTAPTADIQVNQADAPSETDIDGETYSVSKVTIAGQNDVSIQALEFTDPSIDTIIMHELTKAYNAKLDSQLIYGTGANGQHRGLKTVVTSDSPGANAIAFSSGNGAGLLGKIYAAAAQIATAAPGYDADTVLYHSRRAAWMASHRDTSGNLFQQGQLLLAAGEQNRAFVVDVAGLGPIRDGNILTTQGAGTNEDDVYVMDIGEMFLAEGDVRTRVLQEVLSGTLQVRIQLYAFSAFAGGRRPQVVCRISGAGLATPTFPST